MRSTKFRGLIAFVASTAAILAMVVAPSAASALPDPAPDDVTALATLDKTASVTEVAPGETFTYTLTIGCSAITDLGCRGAVLTDTVPAPFVVIDAVVGGGVNSAAEPVIDGNTVTVTWTTPLGDGTVGILDATTGIVSITAQLPVDTSYDVTGIPATNNATIEGTNFVDAFGVVDVTPVIPLALETTANKTLTPSSSIATAGTPVTAALSGSNGSNATVETLTIQDPTDVTAAPNPFDALAFTGFGTVTPPAGADPALTSYEVYVDGAWVAAPGGTLPPTVTPDEVKGTRVIFTGSIPAGATASVELGLQITPAGAALPDGSTIVNTVGSTVALADETATAAAEATFTIRQNAVTVAGSKTFFPDVVVAGESSLVTISGTNTSAIPIETFSVREPSGTGTFPADYVFTGFTGPVDWPATAVTGTVVYTFQDGTTETLPFADGTQPPDPTDRVLDDVVAFELQFTGSIQPDSSVTARFVVETDPDLEGLPSTVTNEIGVSGSNAGVDASATATDDLYIYDEQIETYVGKQIRPPAILAVPGQVTTVSLRGGLTERPAPPETPDGSTGRANQVVIQDPPDEVEPNAWWNAFDLTAITQTPVPGDATLTIEYWDTDTDQWLTLAGPIIGPTIYSQQVPTDVSEAAGGVRFVYDYTGTDGGFAPGTDFAPNFSATLREDGRYSEPTFDPANPVLANCAQTDATSPTPGVDPAQSVLPPEDCPQIELIPPGPGNGDIVDKSFGTSSSGGVKSVIARSADTIPSVLRWSTGGYSGIEEMTITDTVTPETTPLVGSVYNAFDLVRVQPITPATDPLIAFDAVEAVELYNGTTWVTAVNNPCTPLCAGTFPGVTLTADEQASTTGVRLVFVESPERAAAAEGNLDAPQVGSGVARSLDNTRPITLTWQVRDTRRSDDTPVLGDELYNLMTDGLVRNTVGATGVFADGSPSLVASDLDDVLIVDVPLTTTTDKNWNGGPLAVPTDPSIPASQFPLSRVTVTTRNTTPARVDTLQITDTAPGSVTDRRQDPFQAFALNNFARIDLPTGATDATVTLFCPDGSSTVYSRTVALGLEPATMPCDVSGLQVVYTGRIAANAAGVVEFDLRLRPYWRGTDERVSVADSPIANTAEGVIADVDPPGVCPPPPVGARYACDQASASIGLADPSFSLTAGKTISPAQQKEDDFSPVTVTLTTQPGGSTRAYTATVTDDDPTFWNAMDFVGPDPLWQLPPPLGKVQVCYLDGGVFTPETVAAGVAAVGGDWTCMPRLGDLSVTAAKAFMSSMPSTIHGLSFQFWTQAELGWLNPVNPVINTPFLVERRVDLRSGGPVPTTRSDQVPAPGEQDAGVFFDTVNVEGVSAEIAPGVRLEADAVADAEYRNLHLLAEISVQKSPSGDVRPGAVIPFTLAYTNAGERPLSDIVFTDELPLDTSGQPQLIFDPAGDPSVPPWSFALSGDAPDPAGGDPLPVDPDLIDIDTSDPTRIVFGMPSGSVLEVGQTYTITLRMMIRPGVAAGTQVANTATMSVAEPLDGCVPSFDADADWCFDTAVVTPLVVPALSTVKSVRADDPVTLSGIPAVRSDVNGFACAADADGYYRYPCVVTTLPGDTEQWHFTVQNTGTVPMDTIVAIDNLPTPGDQGLIVVAPRGSQWGPTLVGDIALEPTATTPAGAVLTTYYSTSSTPCTADLNPLGTPCAPTAWLPYEQGSTDPAAVGSLKFVVEFDGGLFDPGDTLDITFRTRTTPDALVDRPYPTAYNTVATGGAAVEGSARVTVPATEGRRVGVSYPTGPITLEKVVTGPAAEFAPETFPVQLVCASEGVDVTGIASIELVPGIPEEITGLPWGAECTATEGEYGQTETIIGAATVGGPDDAVGIVTVTNVFDVASLVIRKTVETDAVDQRGDPISYGPFAFAVTCTAPNGAEVWATGYDADNPMQTELTTAETWALGDLPDGSTCTVSETDDLGAVGTSMIVTTAAGEQQPVEGPFVEATVETDTTVEVRAVNAFDAGSLVLEKVVEGDAADDFAPATFGLVVDCVLDTGSGPVRVWLGRVTLGGENPLTTTIDDIATGAVCTVTEPDPGGATRVDISPESVQIGGIDSEPVEVTVTNTFVAGSVAVEKIIDGEGADAWGAGPFTVTLDCTNPLGQTVEIPGGAERVLDAANGYAATYDPLLTGLLCTLTETDAAGATTSVVTDAGGEPVGAFLIEEEETFEVTLTNTFDVGSLVVAKTVSGSQASTHENDTFTIDVSCVWNGSPIEIPEGATRSLTVAAPATYDGLPVGAECRVSETNDGGASAVTMTPASDDDPRTAVVVVAAGAAASVTVDNRFDALPPTGGEATAWIALGAVAVLLGVAGVVLLVVRRRREE